MESNRQPASQTISDLGLEIVPGTVEVGNVYPIFGMITGFISEAPGNVVAELNNSIIVKMNISDDEKVGMLKERAYESGIFISKVTKTDPAVEAECLTVIFGKKQSFNA